MVLTTACRAEAIFSLDVDEDGSGTFSADVGIDDELMGLVEQAGGSIDDLLALVPDGEDVETRREGDMTFYTVEDGFADASALRNSAGVFEGANVSLRDVTLVVEDGGARLDAQIEAPDAGATLEALGGGALGTLVDDIVSANLFVSLPGEVEESNADEIMPDGRLRWEIPLAGGVLDVHAVTVQPGAGVPWLLIIAIAAGALLVLAAIFWPRRRHQSAVGAIEAVEAPPAPAAVFDATAEPIDDYPTGFDGR